MKRQWSVRCHCFVIPLILADLAIDLDLQLSYCNAKLALLLQLAQTRFGAATVLNAGLFHAIKESGLFVIDPDLGVGMRSLPTPTPELY